MKLLGKSKKYNVKNKRIIENKKGTTYMDREKALSYKVEKRTVKVQA